MALTRWGKRHEAVKQAEQFLAECCTACHLPQKSFSKGAKEWIGRRFESDGARMRELVYSAALMAPATEVDALHFPPRHREDHEAFFKARFEDLSLEEAMSQKLAHFFLRLGKHEMTDMHRLVMKHVERPLISLALQWAEENQLKAARLLGINRNTLRKKIRELEIKKRSP